jgi:predicted enzyme related to lactoylglutathione lyase
MSTTLGAFVWYELLTTDADAAQSFYAELIGWRISDSGMPNMDYRMCATPQGGVGGIMQLTTAMLDGGARPCWLGYVSVADVENSLKGIAAAGGSVMVPPSDIPEVGRWAMIADPQGIPVYVIALEQDAASAFDANAEGHCAWNELATPDSSGALEFYTSQFGWQLGEAMDMGESGVYQMVTRGDDLLGGIMQAGEAPPLWRFYFRVPNLAAALERLRAGGGTLIHGPQSVPGDDEIAIGADPQGALFALVARRKSEK